MNKPLLITVSVIIFLLSIPSAIQAQPPNDFATVQEVATRSENWTECQNDNALACHLFVREVQQTLNPTCTPSGWGLLSKNPGEWQCTETRCGPLGGEGFGEDVITIIRDDITWIVDIVGGAGAPGAQLQWVAGGDPWCRRQGNEWACGGTVQEKAVPGIPTGETCGSDQEDSSDRGGPPFAERPQPVPPTDGLPTNLGELIKQIFSWSLGLLGISVFIMFFYAGFLWLTAAGNTAKVGDAKSKMTNAVLGAILLLSSYLILYTINPDFVRNKVNLPGIDAPQQSTDGGGGGR